MTFRLKWYKSINFQFNIHNNKNAYRHAGKERHNTHNQMLLGDKCMSAHFSQNETS